MTMAKRALDVGQCSPDHAAIRRLLESRVWRGGRPDARPRRHAGELRRGSFDLVLINRKLDADYSDGLEILHKLKADAELATVPVMLVSNYADAQATAVTAGAIPGFGKAELGRPETAEKLRVLLQ